MTKQKSQNLPYKQGDAGYNRQSGRKTLVLVCICIALVITFSVLAFLSLK